jgi:hypothetical protein
MKKTYYPIIFIAIGLCLFVTNSAIWFNQNIFNTNQFTAVATEAIVSPSSRLATAKGITNKIFENRPLLLRVLDDTTTKIVSGLLDTAAAHAVMSESITRLHTVITSEDPQPIVINLVSFKAVLSRIASVIDQPAAENSVNIEDIPDAIVLLNPENLPNIYQMGATLMWLGPLLGLIALGLLLWLLFKAWADKLEVAKIFLWTSLTLVATGALSLMVGPIFRPRLLVQVTDENARVIVTNLYNAFLTTYNQQTLIFFSLAIISLIIFGVMWLVFRKTDHSSAAS